uniref:Uncharacterized protein n=1 Tax=Pipistrellus kuhlii TaxID=59472 RepID=A0A7J7V0S9_PIPKU|nr:hypothetical protein mPipKuh1_008629 [Pipistrellus kuhlii]
MGLSQPQATRGPQELAQLGLGRMLRAVDSTAQLASLPVLDRLPEQHPRAPCGACEGLLWRSPLQPLPLSVLCCLYPHQALALQPSSTRRFLKHLLCEGIAGPRAKGQARSACSEKYERRVCV